MNIYLVPYTWARHVHVATVTGSCALVTWWILAMIVFGLGAPWPIEADGPVYIGLVASSVAVGALLAEGGLCRHDLKWFATRVPLAFALSALVAVAGAVGVRVLGGIIMPDELGVDAGDPSLVSLRYTLLIFAIGGLGSAVGTLSGRRFRDVGVHLGAGVAAGLSGAAVWFLWTRWPAERDLYVAGAAGALTWGLTFGLLAWGIPDSLYAGWLRVLSGSRFGRRIPVDAVDAGAKERFVGHFPRGADLWLPVDEGVQELHVSISVDQNQLYRAHGLSQYPVSLRRFLEKLDLRYDPRRPAPVVSKIQSGDRLRIGDGQRATELEFIMLPREES